MSSEVLEWVHSRLADDEEIVVPLKSLWNDWHAFHDQPSFDRFSSSVLEDERFEELYCLNESPELDDVGYVSGPRIKLRSRELTAHAILRLVGKHNERITKALQEAAEILKEDTDGKMGGELDEAILMIEGLRPALSPWVHLRPPRRARRSRPKAS